MLEILLDVILLCDVTRVGLVLDFEFSRVGLVLGLVLVLKISSVDLVVLWFLDLEFSSVDLLILCVLDLPVGLFTFLRGCGHFCLL